MALYPDSLETWPYHHWEEPLDALMLGSFGGPDTPKEGTLKEIYYVSLISLKVPSKGICRSLESFGGSGRAEAMDGRCSKLGSFLMLRAGLRSLCLCEGLQEGSKEIEDSEPEFAYSEP